MKTKFKKYAALICALCTVLLVVSGCAFDELQIGDNPKAKNGVLTLSINGADTTGRTIYPKDVKFERYEVDFVKGNDTTPWGGTREQYEDTKKYTLIAGEVYTVNVRAFLLKDDADYVAEGTATIPADFFTTGGGNVEVKLNPKATGNGFFELHIGPSSIDPSVFKVTVQVGTGTPVEIYGDNATADGRKITLAAGSYKVKFTVFYEKGAKQKSFIEDLYVFPGFTSAYACEFQSFEFYDMLDVVLDIIRDKEFDKLDLAQFTILSIECGDDADATLTAAIELLGDKNDKDPTSLNELKALVDAALVQVGLDAVETPYADLTAASTAIKAFVLNGSTYAEKQVGSELFVTIGGMYVLKTDKITLTDAQGGKDSALNKDYVREGTKIWSMTEWLEDNSPGQGTVFGFDGSPGVQKVAGGLNMTLRQEGWASVQLQLTGSGSLNLDIANKEYRITLYGVMLADGADKFSLGNNARQEIVSEEVRDDKTFQLSYETPLSNLPVVKLLPLSNNAHSAALFRITLFEVEELRDRDRADVKFIVDYPEGTDFVRNIVVGDVIGDLPIDLGRDGYLVEKWVIQGTDEVAKADTVVPVGGLELKAIWKVGYLRNVQRVTGNSNGAGIYNFPLSKTGKTWGDIAGISYYVKFETAHNDFNFRHHVMMLGTTSSADQTASSTQTQVHWGDGCIKRWVGLADAGLPATTLLGANYVGNWVEMTGSFDSDGTNGVSYNKWTAAAAETRDVNLMIGLSNNNFGTMTYLIMHVSLVFKDGTRLGAIVNDNNVGRVASNLGSANKGEFVIRDQDTLPTCPCCLTNAPTDCKGGCSYCYCEGCECESKPAKCACNLCALEGLRTTDTGVGKTIFCTTFDWTCTTCNTVGSEPSAPFEVPLIFQDDDKGGEIEWVIADSGYAGISAKIGDLTGFTLADFANKKYNRIEVGVVAYKDVEASEELETFVASSWTATLFKPWNTSPASPMGGYGNDLIFNSDGSGYLDPQPNDNTNPNRDFPHYTQTGANGRLQGINNTANDTIVIAASELQALPEGIRVERGGGTSNNQVKALRLYSLRFVHTGYTGYAASIPAKPAPQVPPATYQVTFDLDDGDYNGSGSVAPVTHPRNTVLGAALPAAAGMTKTNYDFVGWFDGATEIKADTVVLKNLNLKAKWVFNKFVVTFELDGGEYEGTPTPPATINQTKNTPIGADLPLTGLTKSGFDFAGWVNQDNLPVTAETVVSKDLQLKATWVSDTKCTCNLCDLFDMSAIQMTTEYCSCEPCEHGCEVCETRGGLYAPTSITDNLGTIITNLDGSKHFYVDLNTTTIGAAATKVIRKESVTYSYTGGANNRTLIPFSKDPVQLAAMNTMLRGNGAVKVDLQGTSGTETYRYYLGTDAGGNWNFNVAIPDANTGQVFANIIGEKVLTRNSGLGPEAVNYFMIRPTQATAEFTITSIKVTLVPPLNSFALDLSNWKDPNFSTAADFGETPICTYDGNAKTLEVVFSGPYASNGRQSLFIPFTSDQKASLVAAKTIKCTINGTLSDPFPAYRLILAENNSTASWNMTETNVTSFTSGTVFEFVKSTNATKGAFDHFLFQVTANSPSGTLTLSSVTFDLEF